MDDSSRWNTNDTNALLTTELYVKERSEELLIYIGNTGVVLTKYINDDFFDFNFAPDNEFGAINDRKSKNMITLTVGIHALLEYFKNNELKDFGLEQTSLVQIDTNRKCFIFIEKLLNDLAPSTVKIVEEYFDEGSEIWKDGKWTFPEMVLATIDFNKLLAAFDIILETTDLEERRSKYAFFYLLDMYNRNKDKFTMVFPNIV